MTNYSDLSKTEKLTDLRFYRRVFARIGAVLIIAGLAYGFYQVKYAKPDLPAKFQDAHKVDLSGLDNQQEIRKQIDTLVERRRAEQKRAEAEEQLEQIREKEINLE